MKIFVIAFVLVPTWAIADCTLKSSITPSVQMERQLDYLLCLNNENADKIAELMLQIDMLGLQNAAYKMRFLALEAKVQPAPRK
jgi:hypothetical protein